MYKAPACQTKTDALMFTTPPLTRRRAQLALLIALLADGLQVLTAGFVWVPALIDVIAMGLTVRLLGFHWLLLPTFAVEFIPIVDALPTWTGCVAAVIALRKREGAMAAPLFTDVNPPSPIPPQIPSKIEDRSTPPRLPPNE